MTYSPTTWTTGDTITASALNKIEQGIADAGGGAGGLVVNVTNSGGTYTMDKTYGEIYEALKAGTPCFVCITTSSYVAPDDIDTSYAHGVALCEITLCYKYDTTYRVVAVGNSAPLTVSNTSYLFSPGVFIFQATDSSSNPTYLRTVYATSTYCTASSNAFPY